MIDLYHVDRYVYHLPIPFGLFRIRGSLCSEFSLPQNQGRREQDAIYKLGTLTVIVAEHVCYYLYLFIRRSCM